MIPKNAIEKAEEGGWKPEVSNWESTPHSYLYEYSFVLSPDFWQSLGKSLGWEEIRNEERPYLSYNQGLMWGWEAVAHRFYDLILTEKSTDEFWYNLLK